MMAVASYRTAAHWIFTLFCLAAVVSHAAADKPLRPYPPRITLNPPPQEAYQANQETPVKLACEASAQPAPTYTWLKDGKPLEMTDTDISMEPNVGTLIIEVPSAHHEGVYQCEAKNDIGIALSIKASLRQAVMKPFDRTTTQNHEVEIGKPFTLHCNPPLSYPKGNLYWGLQNFVPISTDARVTQDYDGNLWFANIEQRDSIGGQPYVCNVGNAVIRSFMQGGDHYIKPIPISGKPQHQPPVLVWNADTPSVAIAGTTKKLKCIFTGYPTPEVTWELVLGQLSAKAAVDDTGLELTIPEVDYEDAGTYRCSATNRPGMDPVMQDLILSVESVPKWVVEPESFQSAEEESAEFFCEAMGVPSPTIQWTINGKPVENLPPDSRRVVTENSISYTNLTKTDAQVLQCNASNIHGYIFSNVYLSVFAEAPSFVIPPDEEMVIAIDQSVMLPCITFGSPMPKVTWKLGEDVIGVQGEEPIEPRYQVSEDGNLTILNSQPNDTGSYECHATNKFGQISAIGKVIVREPTKVTKAPESQVVNVSSTIVLECEATTDPNELDKLTVDWKYKGKFIDYDSNPRITKNEDNSLTIAGVTVDDTGEYACVADNGLDTVEVAATITVKDKPSPPEYFTMSDCGVNVAVVEWIWRDELDNNDEVIEFIVYYNTSFDEPDEFHEATRVPGDKLNAAVELSPWANFTFHVRARNSMGLSDRSEFSYEVCTTAPAAPFKNPSDVCVDLRDQTKLIITWRPMPQIEHNGEGFHYRVSYTSVSGGHEVVKVINDWRQGELEVPDVATFKKYEIYVLAGNELGIPPMKDLKRIYGHSGEGEPLDFPENFAIDPDSINSTSAMFLWDPVDESPERVLGHFRGYKIEFWRTTDPDNVRSHLSLSDPVDICPLTEQSHRRRRQLGRRQADGESALVDNLWAFSTITAGILVLNSGRQGKLSPTIEFKTPEGVPGVLGMFVVKEKGSYHFGVAWSPPAEPNGIIRGYVLGFTKVSDPAGALTEVGPVPFDQTTMYLCGLDPEESYLLYMWATTSQGDGERLVIQDTTEAAGKTDSCDATGLPIVAEKSAFIWWILLLCVVVLIMLILLIIFLVIRDRRGKYEVFENEKLRGRDPDKDIKDEGFAEVGDDPEKGKEPAASPPAPPGDEMDEDSLADYGDWDPGRFKEDGSFIGEYADLAKPSKDSPSGAPIAQTANL